MKEAKALLKHGKEFLRSELIKNREIVGECWEWSGGTFVSGYGRINIDRISIRVHRLSYLVFTGPLRIGLVIDHICRNRRCFRPEHLGQVTAQVNAMENNSGASAINAAKTHCKNGHPLSGTNLYTQKKTGYRYCRKCSRARGRVYESKLRKSFKKGSCAACGNTETDRCHIRSFKVSQCDEPWNLICLCRTHHNMQHKHGWMYLMVIYSEVRKQVEEKGWVFDRLPDGSWKMSNEKEVQLNEARRGIG